MKIPFDSSLCVHFGVPVTFVASWQHLDLCYIYVICDLRCVVMNSNVCHFGRGDGLFQYNSAEERKKHLLFVFTRYKIRHKIKTQTVRDMCVYHNIGRRNNNMMGEIISPTKYTKTSSPPSWFSLRILSWQTSSRSEYFVPEKQVATDLLLALLIAGD